MVSYSQEAWIKNMIQYINLKDKEDFTGSDVLTIIENQYYDGVGDVFFRFMTFYLDYRISSYINRGVGKSSGKKEVGVSNRKMPVFYDEVEGDYNNLQWYTVEVEYGLVETDVVECFLEEFIQRKIDGFYADLEDVGYVVNLVNRLQEVRSIIGVIGHYDDFRGVTSQGISIRSRLDEFVEKYGKEIVSKPIKGVSKLQSKEWVRDTLTQGWAMFL